MAGNDGINVCKAGAASDHTRVALFTPVSAPILQCVNSMHAAKVFKERERYGLEMKCKKEEVPTL